MTSVKAPVKRHHYQLWAGEVTMVIDPGNGELSPLVVRANAMTRIDEAGKITPNDLSKAQQMLQMNVYKTLGSEYQKVKDVLSAVILFSMYMGRLSNAELEVTIKQQEVQVKELDANDPYAK